MHIVIHQPRISYYIGGGEIVPLEQARFLAAIGHRITILTRRAKTFSEPFKEFLQRKPKSINVRYIEIGGKYTSLLSEKPGLRWSRWDRESVIFGQYAQSFYEKSSDKIDIVATHLSTDSFFIPRSFKNVLHLHGVPNKKNEVISLSILRPDLFCAASINIMRDWRKMFPEMRKIKLTHNGIDHTKFIKPLESDHRDIDVLFVGRFLENKGIFDLADALKLIPSIRIVFIGSGLSRNEILRRFKNKRNVTVLSNVSTETLVQNYQQAKMFVCPSTSKEGVLTTMLEAAACGCAIVTADCCGMVDFAKNNYNALLVPPKNVGRLRNAIRLLLENSSLRKKIALNAQSSILKRWTWETRIKGVEAMYMQCLRNS